MSDWKFLNLHRVIPIQDPVFGSTESDGFNGMFVFPVNGITVRCIASDGLGWQHVSVSRPYNPHFVPSWEMMCKIKELFWEDEDWVVQFHPAKSEHVNFHPGCLHLWRCTDGRQMPTPLSIMVGPKKCQDFC